MVRYYPHRAALMTDVSMLAGLNAAEDQWGIPDGLSRRTINRNSSMAIRVIKATIWTHIPNRDRINRQATRDNLRRRTMAQTPTHPPISTHRYPRVQVAIFLSLGDSNVQVLINLLLILHQRNQARNHCKDIFLSDEWIYGNKTVGCKFNS